MNIELDDILKSKIETRESMLVNGKLYADFIQWGAETGRFSSRNPNLQNIPAPEDPEKVPEEKQYGRMIRNLFIAPEGHKLVVADYSQIEPRVIAAMSKDPIMVDNYLNGGDIYTTVGNTMGVNRKAGKVLVLAMAYGVGPDKISSQIGCSVPEAKALFIYFFQFLFLVACLLRGHKCFVWLRAVVSAVILGCAVVWLFGLLWFAP
jgi:DNA polymerase-1